MNINYNEPFMLGVQFHSAYHSLFTLRVQDKRLVQFRKKLHDAIQNKVYPKLTEAERAIITNAQYAVDLTIRHALSCKHVAGSNPNEYKWTIMFIVDDYDILSLPHEQFMEKLEQELHQLN